MTTPASVAMLSERVWDVVVVGAGPAGSVAARELARAGASVCLLERAVFPRTKPCGYCVNRAAMTALERIGLGDLVITAGGIPIRKLDLAVGGRSRARAVLALRSGAVLARSVFDWALVRAAAAEGAIFSDGVTARLGPVVEGGRWVEVQHNGERGRIRARVVLAADGIGGTLLRDEPDLQPIVSPASYIGVALTLPAADCPAEIGPGVICMTCGQSGYVGAVRLGTGELHLAAAIDPSVIRSDGGPGAAASRILHEGGRQTPGAIASAQWRGTPGLSRRRKVEGEGVLVIGDAAGYVEPFTGEGMAWAIMSAVAAAPIALASVRGDAVRGQWTRRHSALVGPRQRVCRAVAWGLRRPGLLRTAVRFAGVAPALALPVLRMIERPPPARLAGGGF
jgi:menaquinone-9 beta-reductase